MAEVRKKYEWSPNHPDASPGITIGPWDLDWGNKLQLGVDSSNDVGYYIDRYNKISGLLVPGKLSYAYMMDFGTERKKVYILLTAAQALDMLGPQFTIAGMGGPVEYTGPTEYAGLKVGRLPKPLLYPEDAERRQLLETEIPLYHGAGGLKVPERTLQPSDKVWAFVDDPDVVHVVMLFIGITETISKMMSFVSLKDIPEMKGKDENWLEEQIFRRKFNDPRAYHELRRYDAAHHLSLLIEIINYLKKCMSVKNPGARRPPRAKVPKVLKGGQRITTRRMLKDSFEGNRPPLTDEQKERMTPVQVYLKSIPEVEEQEIKVRLAVNLFQEQHTPTGPVWVIPNDWYRRFTLDQIKKEHDDVKRKGTRKEMTLEEKHDELVKLLGAPVKQPTTKASAKASAEASGVKRKTEEDVKNDLDDVAKRHKIVDLSKDVTEATAHTMLSLEAEVERLKVLKGQKMRAIEADFLITHAQTQEFLEMDSADVAAIVNVMPEFNSQADREEFARRIADLKKDNKKIAGNLQDKLLLQKDVIDLTESSPELKPSRQTQPKPSRQASRPEVRWFNVIEDMRTYGMAPPDLRSNVPLHFRWTTNVMRDHNTIYTSTIEAVAPPLRPNLDQFSGYFHPESAVTLNGIDIGRPDHDYITIPRLPKNRGEDFSSLGNFLNTAPSEARVAFWQMVANYIEDIIRHQASKGRQILNIQLSSDPNNFAEVVVTRTYG